MSVILTAGNVPDIGIYDCRTRGNTIPSNSVLFCAIMLKTLKIRNSYQMKAAVEKVNSEESFNRQPVLF